ncbi:MAG: L,D-transpeptidase family protein [Pseudomonadota bacterium]
MPSTADRAPSMANRMPAVVDRLPAVAPRANPEQLLIEVYKALGANQLRKAQERVDVLVAAYPTFRLGQLLRGDLLMMHTHHVDRFGYGSGVSQDALRNLREEAMVRLKSLRERPDPDLMPRAILQLRPDQRFALLVDARRSRLYVFQNVDGRPKLLTDYYISQGKLGVNKLREGDQKTPIGVYYITSQVAGARLPDFYGTGALPINYPNDWDRVNGRSGSGIWLHGVPSDSYSRPPLSSDGCVVLTNEDLNKLLNSIDIGKTPVVITEYAEFVSKEKWDGDKSVAERVLENWRTDIESANVTKISSHYSRRFRSERGEDRNAWMARHRDFTAAGVGAAYNLQDISAFGYPGSEKMMVITFTQQPLKSKARFPLQPVRKRQYWVHEGAQWKIISESVL